MLKKGEMIIGYNDNPSLQFDTAVGDKWAFIMNKAENIPTFINATT